MRKILLIGIILILGLVETGLATTYTGSITSPSGGLYGAQLWGDGDTNPDTMLSWTVDDTTNSGLWTYNYTFTNDDKDLSHIIIEVSSTFTSANIKNISSNWDTDAPKTYTSAEGNPGMISDLYGIKWDVPDATNSTTGGYNFWIVSDRAPMWGDFYAKDGKYSQSEVIAYNTGFGIDTSASIADGNAGTTDASGAFLAWILVPDTTGGGGGGGGGGSVVPEPATMMLFGFGLLGLAGVSRKRSSRK